MDIAPELKAIEDIKRLRARYLRGVDTKDRELLRSVFADDVVADYRDSDKDPATGARAFPGVEVEILHGADAVTEFISASVMPMVTVHHCSTPDIEVTSATTAKGVWPMVDRLLMPPESEISELVGWGHYHETYECIGGEWKIKTLKLTRLRVDFQVRNKIES